MVSPHINPQQIDAQICCLTHIFIMGDILTAAEVAAHFRISVSTLKRWVMLTRRGAYDLPLPISPKRSQLRWRREDIETWNSCIGNVPEKSLTKKGA